MSTDAITLVKSRRLGSTSRKAVLLILADYADSEWSSFASQKTIAAQAEVGERTVRRILADLEEEGILRRERRHSAQGHRVEDCVVLNPEAIDRLPIAYFGPLDEACVMCAPVLHASVEHGVRSQVTAEVRQRVFLRWGRACLACGSVDDLHIDHIVPIDLGGSSHLDNLQPLCASCNVRKGATPPGRWMAGLAWRSPQLGEALDRALRLVHVEHLKSEWSDEMEEVGV